MPDGRFVWISRSQRNNLGWQGREAYRLRVAEGIIAAWDASPADPALALEEAADTMFLAPAPSVREATNVLLRALGMPGGPSA